MRDSAAKERTLDCFAKRFGTRPYGTACAPGRVNLIGEHTDYNDGFVLPMAIDRQIFIAARPRRDRQVNLYALDLEKEICFSLDGLQRGLTGPEAYLQGVAWALSEAGYPLGGFDGVLHGDIPIGAGLSSSAALELAAASAFVGVNGAAWEVVEMARIAQRAENEWVGVACGIMDQLSSALGGIQRIDCRSLESQPVPLPTATTVVVMDTGTRRGLVESAYNQRRQQCSQAAAYFGVPALRDVSPEMLEKGAAGLDPLIARRARHVVSENQRVQHAYQAMRQDDAETLGALMTLSHNSLRDDFEVSSPALDTMVSLALEHAACWGARMTGAGFGGCAVALVKDSETAEFITAIGLRYEEATGRLASLYACRPAPGASFTTGG